MARSALLVIDMQNDFMDGGVLAVPGSTSIVPVINRYMEIFHNNHLPIYATRDWHPPDHISFRERGGPWPPHCIRFTEGAAFFNKLRFPDETEVISKAMKPDEEAYSGFQGTDLALKLRKENVTNIFIAGVATEYCVFSTAMDGLKNGFKVFLLGDAVKGINESDSDSAVSKMKAAEVYLLTINELDAVLSFA
ncbi:MAG: isochorismatase family protein [Conexivisphaerales archaeon]